MLLTRWLNQIVGRLRSARTRTRSNSQRRSSLAAQIAAPNVSAYAEPLEDRRLLAAVIGGLDGDSLVYSGNSAVVIDQGTSASVIGTIAVGGQLTVSITTGGDTSEDVLSIRNEGTGLGQIGVSGSNVTYSGLPLGTFTGGTGGSNLVVTFNAISLVAIGDLLQNITYQNTDTVSPTTGTRTVGFTINDGLGILSSPISAAVNVVSSLSAGVSGGTLQLNSVPTGATLTLSRSGANVRVTDPINVLNAGLGVLSIDSHTIDIPLASLTNGIVINGGSGAEIINVDFSGGTPIPLSGLTLSGGAGSGDVLNLDNVPAVGSGGFSSVVYAYSSSDTGSVTLDADSNPATTGDQVAVSFSGLESLSNDGVSANLVFNLPATSGATLALNDQGSGVTRLSLTGSETVDFASPAAGGSMTLNLGANDQTLNVTSLAMPAGAALTIDGDSADTINLNASGLNITGALSLSAGTIAQTQPVAVAGLTTLDAGPTGSITLNNAGNNFGTVAITSALNATLRDTNAIDLGTSSVAGTLNVTSNGAMTDSGNLSVTGTATLAAGAGNSITLNSAGNDFATVAITSALNATLSDSNRIDLGTSSVAGTLNVTSDGAITDSGTLLVSGSTSLAAGATNDITLDSANDFSGPVAIISGNNVTLNDTNAIDLGGSTISGNLTLTSNGAITDSGNLSVTGTAMLTAGAGNNVTLNSVGNDFSTVLIGSALNLALLDANALDLGNSTVAGTLSITSNGNVTDSGNLSVTGNANFAAGSGTITLGNAVGETTNFGALTFNTTGAVLISEDSDTVLNGTSIANSLALTSSGAITDAMTASLTVTNNARLSGSSITLGDQAGDTTNFGSVSFSSPGAVTISEDSAMNVGGTAASSAGTLTLVSQTGGITVEDTGLATDLSATGPITFNMSSNEQAFTINPGSAITTSSGGVTVLADDMNLQGTISAVGQTVSLRSSVGADAINLGAATDATANTLELSDAELDRINAGTLAIGDGSAGSVTISAPINRTSATSLSITTGSSGGITFGAGSLDASGGNVTLTTGSGGIVSGSLTTDVSGNAISITAGSAIGASGNPLTTAVSSMTTDTSAPNANQFLSEADSTLVRLNAGSGTIELSSGTFTLSGSEVLNNNSEVIVNSPAVLNLGGFGETIDGLAGSGTITDGAVGAVTLTVGANGGSSTFSGALQNGSGTVGLTKIGSGTLALTGTNTYTGATTVNAGSLLIDGLTAAGSAVSVSGSAILGGTGIISGPVTLSVGSAATLSPGSPVSATADLATGNLTLNAGTTFSVQVNGATVNTQYDQVTVNGLVNLGNATLNLTGAITSNAGQQFVLIANDGTEAVVGTFSGLAEGATVTINGVNLMLSYRGGAGGNDVTLTQAGPVTYTSNGVGTGVLQLRLNGSNVEFVDDGVVVDSRPAVSVLNQMLTVNGASGETLTVDYSQGFFDADVLWHGSTGGLNVVGGTFTSGSETFTTTGPGNSGSVMFNNGVGTATITYDGASSVNLAGTSISNLSLNLPSTTNSVVLEDSGASNDGVSRLRSLGGSLATTTFANPSGSLTINGSTGSDSVELASTDSTFAGTLAINFGAGSDTLRGALVDAVTQTNSDANGFDGTETSATTAFADVETVIGNGGTLTGQNVASNWTLNGSPTYSTGGNTLNVSGFATLQGGSGNDQFVISAASPFSLNGGAGSDSFTFTNSGSVTGSVDGGSGTSDTLIGDSDDNAFGITIPNGGTLSGKTAGWSNIENLLGGVGSDTFMFANLGSVSGTVNGSAGNDTLIGDNDGNDFRVTSANSGTLTDKTSGWTGIENLTGGNGDDHFTLNAPMSGSVSGLSQIIGDTLDGTMIGDAVLIGSSSEGYSGTQSNIAGGFNGIDLLFSTGGVLVGEDVASIWTLNGSASTYSDGSRTLTLNGFTTLQGGSAADSFRVIGDSTFQLRGGDGNDLFDIDARLNGTADGEAGNDTLDASGSTSAVTLLGSAGADSLIGGMFNDSLDGGADNDVLTGNAGNDSLIGGTGTDTANGGIGTDTLFENVSGNVTLSNTALTGAEAGSNSNVERFVLMGSDGNDRLDASAFTGGPVTLLGLGGNDTLIGSNSGGDLLDGGADNDFTFVNKPTVTSAMTVIISGDEPSGSLSVNGVSDALASIESVSVLSGSGRDTLDGSAYFGTVTLLGNGGDDVIRGSRGGGFLNGMAGNDSIVGGDGNETILGGANNDTLFGNGGNDVLKGQAHTDSIDGGAGDDTLWGEGDAANNPAGNDTLKGGDGDDWLDGGAGNDRMDGDAGYDTLLGGLGRDRMNGGSDDDSLNGGADNDTMLGGTGHDSMNGGAGNDLLHGGEGDDSIDGQAGADTLLGAAGHDSLMGGAGNDLVLGGDGDDSIWGGDGKDTLAGQAGDEDRLFDATAAEINEVFTFDDRFLFV